MGLPSSSQRRQTQMASGPQQTTAPEGSIRRIGLASFVLARTAVIRDMAVANIEYPGEYCQRPNGRNLPNLWFVVTPF